MKITWQNGLFLGLGTFAENQTFRLAGFRFHPGQGICEKPAHCLPCRRGLGRVWWSAEKSVATRLLASCDDPARAQLAEHVDAVTASRALDARIDIPIPEGLALFPYQKAGVQYLIAHPAAILADEMGVGKTIQVLAYTNKVETIESVLVVCPASLKINWLREARRWLVPGARPGWRYYVAEENRPVPTHASFVIVNYEKLLGRRRDCSICKGERWKDVACPTCNGSGAEPENPQYACKTCRGKKIIPCPECRGRGKVLLPNALRDSLAARQWDLIACDEAHYLKNPDSGRSRALLGDAKKGQLGLCDQAKRKVFVTGTPIMNKPIEAWPLLAACAPDHFGDFMRFARRYCDAHEEFVGAPGGPRKKKVWKFDGSSNLEELQEKARATCLIRRRKLDVLTELPPKIRQVVPLPVSSKDARVLDEELSEFMTRWGGELDILADQVRAARTSGDTATFEAATQKLEFLQRVTFMEMSKTRHLVARAKLPYCLDYLGDAVENLDKVVIFAHHHDIIEAILERFKNEGAVAVYGPMDTEKRQASIDAFQNDPKTRIFVGSIQAAGVGLTLTAASTVIFVEADWVPANLSQAEDRLHRIGQQASVTVQHLVWDGSLDARMLQLVLAKQEMAERALDRPTLVAPAAYGAKVAPEEAVAPVDSETKATARLALVYLAQEGRFSRHDHAWGHKLATMERGYSDSQAHAALRLCRHYRGQLPLELHARLGLDAVPKRGWTRRPSTTGTAALDTILE